MRNLNFWLIAEEHVPGWLSTALSDPKMRERAQGTRPARFRGNDMELALLAQQEQDGRQIVYPVTANGTAIIPIIGVMQKARDMWMDLFGGASTEEARAAIQMAASDPKVDAIFLRVDSPGGDVAGTEELADAVWAARQVKPTSAHIEDLGASAALWVAAQAETVTANKSAIVGSVGAVMILADVEAALAEQGIKVHVIASGEYKGALYEPGVTEKTVEYVQGLIDDVGGVFQSAVRRGRGLSAEAIAAVSDGKVYRAAKAQELGLIDAVMGRDRAFSALEKRGRQHHAANQKRSARRAAALQDADDLLGKGL